MDNRLKRFLSLALAIVMVIGMMPANIVFATETESTPGEGTSTQEPPAQEDPAQVPAVVSECADGCVLADGHTGDCRFCTKDATCVLEKGHDGDCRFCAKNDACVLEADHDGNCKIMCDENAGCILEKGHDGDCKFMCDETTGCILVDGHEGSCKFCTKTSGCILAANHDGNCRFCEKTEGCVLPADHTEPCKNSDGKLLVGSSTVSGVSGLSAAVEVDGSTIVLTDNIVLTAPVTITKTIILDMNGKSITVAAPSGENQSVPDYALINEGTLTVKGNGTIVGIDNKETGNLTILNGTIIASVIDSATDPVTYAVRNSGNAAFGAEGQENSPVFQVSDDVNHGKFAIWNEAKATSSKSMTITKGTYEGVYNHFGVLNIDGGNLNATAGNHAVQSVDGKLDIDGGTFQKNEAGVAVVHVSEHCIATIDGASISNPNSLALELTGTAEVSIGTDSVINDGIKVEGNAKLTVTGGTFRDTGTNNYLPEEYNKDLNISVQGGTFIDTNAQTFAKRYAAPGKILAFQKESSGTTGNMVKSGDQTVGEVVAMIGDFAYASVQAAVDGAKAKDVIRMVSNATNAAVTIQNGKEVTLDLNGKTVASTSNAIEVQTGGKLTITDSATGGTVAKVESCGNVTVIGGTVTKLIARGTADASATGLSTVIKGGTVDKLEARVYAGDKVGNIVTIENSVQGETKVVPTVNNVSAYKPQDSTVVSKVYIKGGHVTGTIYTYETDETNTSAPFDGAIFITGGIFDRNYLLDRYIVDGYEIITATNYYEVRLKIVDLKAPDGTEQQVLVNNSGSTVSLDTVMAAISANESLQDVDNKSGYTLVIRPLQIVLDAGSPYKTSSITYDVFLKDKPQSEKYGVTFNLPIPGTLPSHSKIANVYHEDVLMGEYEIKGEGAQRYVTVTVDSFSKFRVEVTDIDPTSHVAKIGIKGYISVGAALNAAQDGDEIILLDSTGNTGHTYGCIDISGSNDKKVTIDGRGYEWAYNGTEPTISIGGSKAVTIKNVRFSTTNAGSAGNPRAIINISGTTADVQIQNCTFTGPGTSSNVVGINLYNAKNVVVSGPVGTRENGAVDASNLTAFLKNTNSENLTVQNMKISSCTNGMELDNIKNTTLTNVDITTTVQGAYGISMKAVRDQHNTVFTGCSISAPLPIMVYGREENVTTGGTAHGAITFNGNNTMDGGVFNGKYWLVVADNKHTSANFNTDPSKLDETTGRIVINLAGTGLDGEGINYKHKDTSGTSVKKYYTVMPTGELKRAEVIDGTNSHILFDIQGLKASERIAIRVYDQHGELIAQTHLVDTNKQYLYLNALSATHPDAAPALGIANTKVGNYWSADWKFAHNEYAVPIFRHVPVKAELVIDGKTFPKFDIVMDARDVPAAEKRVWTDIDGVGNLTMNDVWYHTLAEALEATRKDGAAKTHTVKLYDDNTAILPAAGEITGGKEVTITTVDYKGDGITPVTLDWGDTNTEYLFVGRGSNTGDGKLIFDAAHIKAAGNTPGAIGIHVSGARKDNDKVNNGILVVQNGSNIELDYLVNRNDVTVTGKNTTLVVRNGFASGGRHKSEARDDAAEISTLTVADHATLIIKDMTGKSASQHEGLGYEGVGKMLVDNATFAYEGEFHNALETGKMQVSGTSTLKIAKTYKGKANSGITKDVMFGAPIELLDGAYLLNSLIDSEVFAIGTDKEQVEVSFKGTLMINYVKVENGTANFVDKNRVSNVRVAGTLNAAGTSEFNDVFVMGTANITGTSKAHDMDIIGTLNTNTESTITVNKINLESDSDKIIVDATNLVKEEGVKVIDQSNSVNQTYKDRISVKDNKAAKQVADDGDVFIYFEAYVDNDGNEDLDIGEGYATVEKAVEEAAKDKTVYLLFDATVEAPVVIDKNIVLDLNKKEIYGGKTYMSVLKVTASDATVKNGIVDAYYSNNTGIEVAADAAVELTDLQIVGNVAGIKASGKVTIGEGTTVTARYSYPAITADKNANVIVNIGTGTIDNGDRCAIELNEAASVTINSGEVKGAPAVRVYGGTLTVNGGKVTRKHATANAIVTSPVGVGKNVVSNVIITAGQINGWIIAEDVADTDVPEGYDVDVVITGGNFTNSRLDEDYIKNGYAEIAVSRAKADVPTTFDNFVRFEMIAPDFTCQKVKDSSPVKYEIVPYEHVRIYMYAVDDYEDDGDQNTPIEKIVEGENIYVDGKDYVVQPGKVILVDKDMAKNTEMFITTYGYETKANDDEQDDYPTAMYVWYAMGTDANKDGICDSYSVERVKELDGFFQYHGTSIRIGGSSNGIRFFSSVNANDANKLMSGTLITDADSALYGAKMVSAGTWFKKTNEARSEVYGGDVGNNFRVFQSYEGRNWFTGVLVGLENSAKNVAEPFQTRPFADIDVDGKTVTLYGGLLKRSIYYVATQNKDVFNGTSYDSFVENLIKMGYDYLHPTTPPAGGNG